MQPIWAVGLMTGTVLDGNIDVALLKTDGERIEQFGPYTLAPYPEAVNAMLREAQEQALAWNFTGPEPDIFARAEAALTRAIPGGQGPCRGKRHVHGRCGGGRVSRPDRSASRTDRRAHGRHAPARRRRADARAARNKGCL